MPLFSVVGVFLCFCIFLVFSSSAERKFCFGFLSSGLIFFYSLVLFLGFVSLVNFDDVLSFGRLMGFVVCFVAVLSFYPLIKYFGVERLVFYLLVAHVGFFYFQFIAYYVFSFPFDPFKLVVGYQQSGWGGTFEHEILGGFIRFGGLFNEPGTYANYISPLIALFATLNGKARKIHPVVALGLLSVVLTFSVFGLVFSLFILAFVLRNKLIFFIPILLPIAVYVVYPYLEYRFVDFSAGGGDSGLGFRSELIKNGIEFLLSDPLFLLVGSGALQAEMKFDVDGAVNDIGLVLYLVFLSGFVAAAFFVGLLSLAVFRNVSVFCAVVIVGLSKISIFAPFFILIISLIFLISARKYEVVNDMRSNL